MKKKILVSVITDLVSDQRVHKICTYLHEKGFEVLLIGRETKHSLPLQKQLYQSKRIYCYFNGGVFMYAEFMFRLFFQLFKKTDLFLANDLDTLLPNFLHATLRNKPLVYDSHEYFTGVPELKETPVKRKIWQSLERFLLPRIKRMYTVNQSIADLYYSQYKVQMKVVRNLPYYSKKESRQASGKLPANKFIILLQGAGINRGRGGEELVKSMTLLPDHFLACFIGSGTSWSTLKQMTIDLHLQGKVIFIEKLPFQQLPSYTRQAHLGVSLDIPTSINYELSLPNKIFDYIHAGVPVLASSVKEVSQLVQHYNVGAILKEVTPEAIAQAVLEIYSNKDVYQQWKLNTVQASEELCWEHEEKVLDEIFTPYLNGEAS